MTSLRCLDVSLPSPAENLACDEALLEWCETGQCGQGILRFWEPSEPFVVLGYANRLEEEVHTSVARQCGVPILRRCSGGGAVLQGPGCLNYSLVLKIDASFEGITETNCGVMKRHAAVVEGLLGRPVQVRGHTDLAVHDLKFSGNSQRRKRHWLLFHGTFLIRADLEAIERFLKHPSREPVYRGRRTHRDFLTTLEVEPSALKGALRRAWNAAETLETLPSEAIDALVSQKYSSDAWNLKW